MSQPFDPFSELAARQEAAKREEREAVLDLKAFRNLARSESGKRVLRVLKEMCDFDGPVHRRNETTGLLDIHEGLVRDGFRGCVAVMLKNAALAESVRFGKGGGA